MTRQPQDARETAKAFHEAYERLAPSFGYETRSESAVPWEQVPEQNRALMEAVVAEVLAKLVAENATYREKLPEIRALLNDLAAITRNPTTRARALAARDALTALAQSNPVRRDGEDPQDLTSSGDTGSGEDYDYKDDSAQGRWGISDPYFNRGNVRPSNR